MQTQVYKDIYEHEMHHWWYRVRRALVADLLKRHTKGIRELTILDVGCGAGGLMNELSEKGVVYGVDFSEESVKFCHERGLQNVQIGDVTSIPFEDNYFDVVVCLDVLEHIDNDTLGAREIYRILKPGGVAILFVPALMILWGETDDVSQHKRRYTKRMFRRTLESGGFSIQKFSYFNSILFFPILATRLLTRVIRHKVVDEYKPRNGFVNLLLYKIFSLEIKLLRYVSFPLGVSILAVCKKK